MSDQLDLWADEPPQDQIHITPPGAYSDSEGGPRAGRGVHRGSPEWGGASGRTQINELPGETWEDIFVCGPHDIDESGGLRDEHLS